MWDWWPFRDSARWAARHDPNESIGLVLTLCGADAESAHPTRLVEQTWLDLLKIVQDSLFRRTAGQLMGSPARAERDAGKFRVERWWCKAKWHGSRFPSAISQLARNVRLPILGEKCCGTTPEPLSKQLSIRSHPTQFPSASKNRLTIQQARSSTLAKKRDHPYFLELSEQIYAYTHATQSARTTTLASSQDSPSCHTRKGSDDPVSACDPEHSTCSSSRAQDRHMMAHCP